jgi:hypothetical protein
MTLPPMRNAKSLFEAISKNAQHYRREMACQNTGKGQWFRYCDKENKLEQISFESKPNAKVQLSLKINGQWKPWLYVDESTIENAGYGVFPERTFEVDDYVSYFMGRKLSKEELENKLFSEYALSNIDPCDNEGQQMHWYLLSHLFNHGNYTIANIRFESNLVLRCIKRVTRDKECLVDYQRPIFCKKCHEYKRVSGIVKRKRVKTRISDEGTIGKCRECKCKTKKLIARECKNCRRQLCLDCYDKFQVAL